MASHTKLAEVARHAGVSSATVSRVMNGGCVREATRGRILRAIEELKYRPNLAARDLAGGRSRTLGVIVSNLENPFFSDIYRTLETDAHMRGYEVFMADTDYVPAQLEATIRLMIGRRVAGLAVVVSEMSEAAIADVRQAKIPAVFFDVGVSAPRITRIRVNYRAGMEKVVSYLHSMGHRKIGYLGHHDLLAPLGERRKAVLNAVARYPALEMRSVQGDDTLDGGRHSMGRLLSSEFDATAVICANDVTAAGALRLLRERGIRVPQDVSIIGFDNVKLSEFCCPALTTVDIPRDTIGHTIFERLTGPQDWTSPVDWEIVVEPSLLLRDSTGPVSVSANLRVPELVGQA